MSQDIEENEKQSRERQGARMCTRDAESRAEGSRDAESRDAGSRDAGSRVAELPIAKNGGREGGSRVEGHQSTAREEIWVAPTTSWQPW